MAFDRLVLASLLSSLPFAIRALENRPTIPRDILSFASGSLHQQTIGMQLQDNLPRLIQRNQLILLYLES